MTPPQKGVRWPAVRRFQCDSVGTVPSGSSCAAKPTAGLQQTVSVEGVKTRNDASVGLLADGTSPVSARASCSSYSFRRGGAPRGRSRVGMALYPRGLDALDVLPVPASAEAQALHDRTVKRLSQQAPHYLRGSMTAALPSRSGIGGQARPDSRIVSATPEGRWSKGSVRAVAPVPPRSETALVAPPPDGRDSSSLRP
jgi:hypothetical protein